MRQTDWYKCKLIDYIYEKYPEHVDKSEWFVNPAPNQFKGYFPELRKLVTFTCDDNGQITEETRLLVKDLDLFHEIVAGCSRGMDAVYEDYVLYLIGQEGFDMLRKNHILESCGSIDGRNLYTVKGGTLGC